MFVGGSIQDVVAFLGWRDPKSPGGIKCKGTGFLLHYKGQGYVVTVRHIAEKLGSDPFAVRINRYRGAAQIIDADEVNWHYHADSLVDLAVTQANFHGPLYFPEQQILSQNDHGPIDIGDFCYTVGLFHFISGHSKNLPFLFTGHIALMPPPGEKIPVGNEGGGTDYVEAYLIENNAIKGASGSPVFVRPTTRLRAGDQDLNVLASRGDIYLMGVFQAAWFLPPDAPLREGVRAKATDVVPVGIGVVIPVYKLVELLESKEMVEKREQSPKVEPISATLAGISSAEHESSDANPRHLEDFTRLVDVAARKRPQGDQT